MFKNSRQVEQEAESIRNIVLLLDEDNRKFYYKKTKADFKDPDTYAVLNYFFILGLHHFYLRKWLHGTINLIAFIVGVTLLFEGELYTISGVIVLIIFSIAEWWDLFRSQIIIADFNNKISKYIISILEDKK